MVKYLLILSAMAAMVFAQATSPARAPKTLVGVWAHADDDAPVAPLLARYAREGAQVYTIIATDGSQGCKHTTVPCGPELARVRSEEARCSCEALGIHPPILLGFPDGKLGDYVEDPSLVPRLTQRIAEELQKLNADALITWGPDGGTGHPDHRIISDRCDPASAGGCPWRAGAALLRVPSATSADDASSTVVALTAEKILHCSGARYINGL
jgi:hypothetical protein